MDPGNYKGGIGALRAFIAGCAAEFGDKSIHHDALEQLDTEFFPVEATESGALRNKALSVTAQVVALMARLIRHQDLANATLHGPDPVAMSGPILAEVEFPDVLVSKAYSHDGKGLDVVLYPGKAAGVFKLGFERLERGKTYDIGGKRVQADGQGRARVDVEIDSRTSVMMSLLNNLDTGLCNFIHLQYQCLSMDHFSLLRMINTYLFDIGYTLCRKEGWG